MTELREQIVSAAIEGGRKISKTEAKYGPGKPEHHCGICEYYSRYTCKIVAGRIEPEDGCRFFEPKDK